MSVWIPRGLKPPHDDRFAGTEHLVALTLQGPRRRIACAVVAAVLFVLPAIVAAQAAKAPVPPTPRTADGKPDLSGVYQASTRRGAEWDFEVPGDVPGQAAPRRQSDINQARREPIPYREEARKQTQELLNRRSIDDPASRCLPQTSPRMTPVALFPMQFVQNAHDLVIMYEYFDEFRVIPIDGRRHPADIEPTYKGDSVGRWDGDTLVIDVVNFKPGGWIAAGVVTSDALHLTERYTRIDREQMNYEVTIEDPKVFTKPWKMAATLMLRDARMREYVCVENNLDPDRYESLIKSNPTSFLRAPDQAR